MTRKRKRLNGTAVVGVSRTRTNGYKPPSKIVSYPNLVRRKQDRRKLNLKLVEALAMLGMQDQQIAKALSITYQKFGWLKKKHSSLKAVLHRGRINASAEVVKSLYKKANGFSIKEEKLFYSAKHDKTVRAITNKYFAPDTVAQIFWLKNQFPELWRDKKEVETTGSGRTLQSIKFVIVQPGGKENVDKVIDADYKILPGASVEASEQVSQSDKEGED